MPEVFVTKDKNGLSQKNTSKQLVDVQPHPLSYFSSYCRLPEGISFQNQEQNERIILFLRQHFITNTKWIILGSILLFTPLLFFLGPALGVPINLFLPMKFLLVLGMFYYLIVLGYIFNNFIVWFYNVGIITTEQIIDVDFTDLMYRNVAKARIYDVIDVEFDQGGLFHSFFDYGNVLVQTQGVKPNFEFQLIPHPDEVTDIILDLKQKAGVQV
jgi:hypothetical protein